VSIEALEEKIVAQGPKEDAVNPAEFMSASWGSSIGTLHAL